MPKHKVPLEDTDSFLTQERQSTVKEWARFKEHIRTEEFHRTKFEHMQEEKKNNTLPKSVHKFILTIKHSVRTAMRNKGGTPFSIIRQMFLYWDRSKIMI
jgi:hypothetical protein